MTEALPADDTMLAGVWPISAVDDGISGICAVTEGPEGAIEGWPAAPQRVLANTKAEV